MPRVHRREFLHCAAGTLAASAAWPTLAHAAPGAGKRGAHIAFGLVTYMWGADWDVPTLLANCRKTNVLGVELRTTHKHGVEPALDDRQREEVRKQFAAAGVTIVGIGSGVNSG